MRPSGGNGADRFWVDALADSEDLLSVCPGDLTAQLGGTEEDYMSARV